MADDNSDIQLVDASHFVYIAEPGCGYFQKTACSNGAYGLFAQQEKWQEMMILSK